MNYLRGFSNPGHALTGEPDCGDKMSQSNNSSMLSDGVAMECDHKSPAVTSSSDVQHKGDCDSLNDYETF